MSCGEIFFKKKSHAAPHTHTPDTCNAGAATSPRNDRPASPCCKWETSQGTSSRSHDQIKLTHDRRLRAMTDDCIHDDGMARGILAHNSLSLRVGVGAKCPVRCGGGSRPWSPASLSRTTAELGHSTLMLPLASPPSREEIELGARPLAALLHSTGWAGTSEPWLPP